jgi:hypothetical protein
LRVRREQDGDIASKKTSRETKRSSAGSHLSSQLRPVTFRNLFSTRAEAELAKEIDLRMEVPRWSILVLPKDWRD